MSQAPRNLPQSKEALLKSYQKRLKDDIKAMVDNYMEIIKNAKVESDEAQVARMTQAEQDQYEMEVRGANIVRAGESLLKLVSDLKQFLILNDYPAVNEAVRQKTEINKRMQTEIDGALLALRDDIAADLYEMEEEYYSSAYK